MCRYYFGLYKPCAVVLLLLGMVYAQDFTCYERAEQLMLPQIVGSADSYTIKEIPWVVNLSFGGQPFCGGTLINKNTVLTAAHCVKRNMVVRRVDNQGTPYGDSAKVHNYAVHPTYQSSSQGISAADLALLRLDKSFDIATVDLPRLLPEQYADIWGLPDDCALVVGWGVEEEGGHKTSDILLGTTLPIWDNASCEVSYTDNLFDGTICAGYKDGQVGSCQGDSGGALVVDGGPTGFIQVGIVSFGLGCGRPDYPTVYTRVSSYYDWIFATAEALD